MRKAEFFHAGSDGISVRFGNEINPETNRRAVNFAERAEQDSIPGFVEAVPSYGEVLFIYDEKVTDYEAFRSRLADLLGKEEGGSACSGKKIFSIPVLYGTLDEECGPDLAGVAAHSGLAPEEVVRRHSEREYLIYMLGFTPGFPYLGGMDAAIAAPRLPEPRQKIAAGSVGIAGEQTGIYPIESPGGWQIIGRSPLKLFEQRNENPVLLQAGAYVKFVPVDKTEFLRIAGEVEKGIFDYGSIVSIRED